jgi:hypothetical protein
MDDLTDADNRSGVVHCLLTATILVFGPCSDGHSQAVLEEHLQRFLLRGFTGCALVDGFALFCT